MAAGRPDGCAVHSLGGGVPKVTGDRYARGMATTPTPEEAVERARRAQDRKIDAVRELAQARQQLTNQRKESDRMRADLEERIKFHMRAVEAADLKAFNAATSAGWTPDELRKIGFPEPEKKRRTRRSTARRTAKPSGDQVTSDAS